MFGKSKKKQDAAQPQQMQISPDALALLQAMQAQQFQAQQMQALQAQQMMMQQPQMGMQPQMQPQMQQPQMQQPQMQPQMAPTPHAGAPAMSDQDLLAELGGALDAPVTAPDQMAQQQMAQQQMAQQQMASQQMAAPVSDSGFAFAAAQPMAPQSNDGAPIKKTGKLTKDEKRAAAAQKKAEKSQKAVAKKEQIALKAEEKQRAKRRKKLAKTRFSRARYLREANGNALTGIILWVFLILLFTIAPFMLNTSYLIPQTNENLRILSEVKSLEDTIVTSRPRISAMAQKRTAKKGEINTFIARFIPRPVARSQLEDLAAQLQAAGLEVEPISVVPAPLTATSIQGTSALVTVRGSYLEWLRVRNKFVRAQSAISIPSEKVAINTQTGQMEISAQIILPSSLK